MADDLIGITLANRYRVDAFVGKGGMAEVYRVWDSRRAVPLAMKLLYPDLAEDRLFLRRFQREAQTLAALQHPHIVRFYGLEQDGARTFMLMDFVDGSTLRREIFDLNGSPASPARLLEILQPVCSALHYAHAQGVAHCDVKPANIMLHRNGTVLVADFGISRLTESATTVTMVGAGTPAYMAPEQVRGENPTPQTDLYALGIVLYELLTGGERPFTGQQSKITGSTSEKVRWEQLNHQPPSPRRFNRQLSPAIEAVVLKCLAKDPPARFSSALELLSALQSALPGAAAVSTAPLPAGAGGAADQPAPDQASPPLAAGASGSANQPAPDRSSPALQRGERRRGARSRLGWLVMAALAVLLLVAGAVFLRPPEPAATAVAAATETAPPPTATAETQPTSGLVAVALAASDTPAPTSTETPAPTVTNTAVRPTRVPTKTRTPFFTRTPTPAPYLASQKNITCGKSPATGKLNISLEAGDYQSYLWHYDFPAPSAQLIVGGFTHALNGSKTSSVKFTLTESSTYEIRYYFECRSPGVAGGYTLTWLQPPFANVHSTSMPVVQNEAVTSTPTIVPRIFSVTFRNTRGDDRYIFVEGKLLGRVPANKSATFPLATGNYYIQACTGRDRTGCNGFQAMILDNITFDI